MVFLVGSCDRQFQSKISGWMERSQAVIIPGENYPRLKANRASLLQVPGECLSDWRQQRIPAGDRREHSRSAEGPETMWGIWAATEAGSVWATSQMLSGVTARRGVILQWWAMSVCPHGSLLARISPSQCLLRSFSISMQAATFLCSK